MADRDGVPTGPGAAAATPVVGAASAPRGARTPAMIHLVLNVWKQRELVKAFVVRDLKSRYVGSTMGFFWSVVVPFIYLFVFMVVFSLFMKSRWTDDARPQDTALFMLVGILSWHAFAETLSRATSCLVDNANLIQKVVFPSEILPAYLTISSIVNMLIGLPIVIVGTYAFTDQVPTAAYLALPILVALQALFSVGLGYFLSALNLFLRDTLHIIGVLILVWMFGTPIFYPPTLVQDAKVPVPGTGRGVEHWVKHDFGRRRTALPGSVSVRLDEERQPRQVWRVEFDREGLSDDVLDFLAAQPEDDRPRKAMTGEERPGGLRSFVEVNGVYYSRQTMEERETTSLGFLLDLNPMYWLINSYRRVIMFGEWPTWSLVARFALVALVVFALGARFFARHQRRFPDLL